MKILQVHNTYTQRGGEDMVVDNESWLLKKHGHDVVQVFKNNSELNVGSKIRLIFNTHYSYKSNKEFRKLLIKEKPDIVHVHNFFPQFTPSIFDTCRKIGIPSVLTLHNFRIFHPNGLLLHDSKIDLRGLKSSAFRCIPDKVYRNSYLQTSVVSFMIEYHKFRNTWNSRVDKMITLSENSKMLFIEGGINEDNLVVKPNFTIDRYDKIRLDSSHENYFVVVGRISNEKGIKELLLSYLRLEIETKLIIIGDGPEYFLLRDLTLTNKNIIWMGNKSHKETLGYIKNSTALIFPSICFENFPMTVVEALSLGVPVLSSDIGAVRYIIDHLVNGYLYNPYNDEELTKGIKVMLDTKINKKMKVEARNLYLKKYTPEVNYLELISIYNDVLSRKQN